MGWLSKVREAVRKAASAIQERAKKVVEAAKRAVQGKPKDNDRYWENFDIDSAKEEGISSPVDAENGFKKSLAQKLEEAQKRADEEKREEQKKKSYDKFVENHGDISREEYNRMWETIGPASSEYAESLGSDVIIEFYNRALDQYKNDLTPEFFMDIFRWVDDHFYDKEMLYAEDFVDEINNVLKDYATKSDFYQDFRDYY